MAASHTFPSLSSPSPRIQYTRALGFSLNRKPRPIPTATERPIQQYGVATSAGLDVSLARLRQEVFRRPIDAGSGDATVMGGIYVDRPPYSYNTNRIALYRY